MAGYVMCAKCDGNGFITVCHYSNETKCETKFCIEMDHGGSCDYTPKNIECPEYDGTGEVSCYEMNEEDWRNE